MDKSPNKLCIQILLIAFLASAVPAACAEALSKRDVVLLSMADIWDIDQITISALAKPDRSGEAISSVRKIGGRLIYTHEPVDFLIAVIPTTQVDKILSSENIAAWSFDINAHRYVSDTRVFSAKGGDTSETIIVADSGALSARPLPVELARSLALQDLNAHELISENPEFDGRGVTIAHVESLPDILHPALQNARLLDGQQTRKIIDVHIVPQFYYGLNPEDDRWEWNFVPLPEFEDKPIEGSLSIPNSLLKQAGFSDTSDSQGADFVYSAMLAEASMNRSGDVAATKFSFIWNHRTEELLLDADLDGSFDDEKVARPFGISGDIITLGTDDPQTAVRETLGLVFQTQDKGRRLAFDLGLADHPTMVVGTATASKGNGGLMGGIAPGAQVIVYNRQGGIASISRAVIAAMSDPRTDLVLFQGFHPFTPVDEVNQGREINALLMQRLVEIYAKPVVITGSNPPGASQVVAMCGASEVMCIGASDTQRSYKMLRGIDIGVSESLHWAGSSGPTTHGAIKPDILVPATTITTFPQSSDIRALSKGLFKAPPGYGIGGGTSNSTPAAAGAVALLISAAKQNGLPHDAKVLHRALRSSARFLEDGTIEAYQQGRGVIDVSSAWNALRAFATDPPIEIDVQAPVRTVHSDHLSIPHQGIGLFEREGWSISQKATRTITLIRRSGAKKPLTFGIDLKGDDKSFAFPESVILPLNTPIKLNIEVIAETAGAHSGILLLRRPGRAYTDVEIGLNVFVPTPLDVSNKYRYKIRDKMRPLERKTVFLKSNDRTDALWMKAHKTPDQYSSDRTPLIGHAHSPAAWNAQHHGHFQGSFPRTSADGTTISFPPAGVWEFQVRNRDLTYMAFPMQRAVASNPEAWHRPTETEFASFNVELMPGGKRIRIKNTGASFYGGLASISRASLYEQEGVLEARQHITYDIDVLAGAELLVAEVVPTGIDTIDADLMVYYCPDGNDCKLVRQARSYSMTEKVVVERPASGRWKAAISTFGARDGAAGFRFRNYWTHPKFGTVVSEDAKLDREVGADWTATFSVVKGKEESDNSRRVANVFYIEAPLLKSSHHINPIDGRPDSFLGFKNGSFDTFVPLGLHIQ